MKLAARSEAKKQSRNQTIMKQAKKKGKYFIRKKKRASSEIKYEKLKQEAKEVHGRHAASSEGSI